MDVPEPVAGDLTATLAALRREYPEARLLSELASVPGEHVVVRVTIELPGYGATSALGSATAGESPRWIELAEDRALMRALRRLSYEVAEAQAAHQSAELGTPVRSTFPVEPASRSQTPGPLLSTPREEPAGQAPAPLAPARRGELAVRDRPVEPATDDAGKPERLPGTRATAETAAPAEHRPASRADTGWDGFWRWARPFGFSRKEQIAEALGRPIPEIQGLSPRELRTLVEAHLRERERRR